MGEMTTEERLQDIISNPEKHRHNFWDLQTCCFVNNSLDPMLMEAHPELGRNGGQKCDVVEGPCSCGDWH